MAKLSQRILNLQASPIRKLAPLADNAKKEGKKVYHLNIGQPDIHTPEVFYEAIKNFNEPVLKYSDSHGISELIDSFIKYYKKWDIHFESDEIMVTNGGSEAILFALMGVCDYGDNVLIPEPFYTNYNGFAQIAGVNVSSFLTKAEEGFHLPPKSEIVKHINDKTRAILLSNPGNPTGVVYTKEEINLIAEIAKEYDLFIIADEVYREFVYDNLEYTSFMKVTGIEKRVILIDSISKRYSACGARIGLVASKNKELIANILKLCQSRLCTPTIEQIGAAKLIDTPQEYFFEVKKEYQKRRDVVFNALKEMPGVVCQKPTGAFYVVAKLPVKDAEDFVKWLLTDFSVNNETVMLAPAAGFYSTEGLGLDEVRISYCLKCEDLEKAMNILKAGLEEYKNTKE
ncbi:pyridoxal phosphate-dependent aminotransferase [Caloramator sp. E03]|uniref:pyridoxal phosphate-dependent aminotransferase n=1 Tax=Caloramator sp. E03 TaxID=2576307 RepID=UPI001110D480|nr:pyridoxal phosphate-dependent aminotransferase [Caloramator sp. E03]QCX32321.1 pyridoxal phosphate-dependent aminotransferase [Caloramator sp. E03]